MTIEDRIKLATRESSYVANAVKHVWLARLLQLLWEHHPETKVQIFHSEVDDAGYDIVLTWGSITRHIQLKASHLKAKRQAIDVHTALADAAGGCVVWMFYEPVTFDIRLYRYFGSNPNQQLPDLSRFKIAKRVFPNIEGIRPERKRIRSVPKRAFEGIANLPRLATKLFGMTFPDELSPANS